MSPTTTVHLNDDYGLSQGEDAAALVDQHLASGVEVLISPGTYAWNSNPLYGGTYDDARLASDTEGELVTLDHGDGFEFTTYFDCSSGVFELQDLEFTGTSVYSSPDNYMAFWASSPDATVRLKNVRRPDGCAQGEDGTAFYVRGAHEGTAEIIDCQAHGFTDNGLYASAPGDPSESTNNGGRIEVIRGYYTNNNISNVRLAGDYYAEDVVCVHDRHTETNESSNTSGHSQRNLWLRDTDAGEIGVNKTLSGEIVNCHVAQLVDFGGTSGEGVAVMMQHRSGSSTNGTLTDCRVTNDDSSYGAIHDAYSNSSWSSSGLHVTGSGDLSTSGHSVECSGSGCETARTEPYPVGGDAGISAPDSLGVTSVDYSSIDVSWSHDGNNLSHYNVYFDGAFDHSTSSSTASFVGLDHAATHEIGVSAVDGDGEESSITSLTATTEAYAADVDTFDRSDHGYVGDVSAFTTTSTPAVSGQSLTLDGVSGDNWIATSEGADDRYIRQGDTIRYYFRSTAAPSNDDDAQISPTFGHSDVNSPSSGMYFARFRSGPYDDLVLRTYDSGSSTTLDQTSGIGYPGGVWWMIEIDWATDDTITARIFDENNVLQAEVSGVDSTHSGNDGTIGWHGYYSSGDVYVDEVQHVSDTYPTDSDTIIDDFEHNNLDAYYSEHESGDYNDFNIQTGTVYESTHALEAVAGASGNSEVLSGSDVSLANVPVSGDTWRTHCRLSAETSNTAARQIFGCQNYNPYANGYVWALGDHEETGADLALLKRENGSLTVLDTEDFGGVPAAEWLSVDTYWNADIQDSDGNDYSDHVRAEVYDSSGTFLGAVSAADQTFASGQIGYWNAPSMSDPVYYDGIQHITPDPTFESGPEPPDNPAGTFLVLNGVIRTGDSIRLTADIDIPDVQADISVTPSDPETGETVTFDGSGSQDNTS